MIPTSTPVARRSARWQASAAALPSRPGARPNQTSGLTQVLRGVLCPGVQHESSRPQLRAREVLQLVCRPVRWIELYVEVVVAPAAAGRALVHRHDVRERAPEKPVV